MAHESYYPDHAGPRPPSATAITSCDPCGGSGRFADDWCRGCAGMGHRTRDDADLAMMADAVSKAAADISELRVAALKAATAFRGLLPYLPRFPPEAELRVRQALRALEGVACG